MINTGDPIAFFLTWVTYGTWLPGDERGWVERGSIRWVFGEVDLASVITYVIEGQDR